jgi:hypothetical protein
VGCSLPEKGTPETQERVSPEPVERAGVLKGRGGEPAADRQLSEDTMELLEHPCECCNAPANRYDINGIPLCDECWEDLKIETAIIQGTLKDPDTA